MRHVVWFSCGAASAVVARLTINEYPDAVIACCVIPNEHPDNERFLTDCERWYKRDIIRLKSKEYVDTWDVYERTRYLVGPNGARCTTELKKKVRRDFQREGDVHVFGFTSEEVKRADRFREQNPDVDLYTPLIDIGLSKPDCLGILNGVGIDIPIMYKMGYQNNNCIGCVKGGMGYWNKIRKDFPEVFQRMAEMERKLNISILRSKGEKIFLDTLDPERGKYSDEPDIECSLLCTGLIEELS